MTDDTSRADGNHLELATELTMAWLSNPNTRASTEDVPAFLQQMHTALRDLATPAARAPEQTIEEEFTPAVTVRRSLASKDHILSLIDGKPYKSLRRHLTMHGLTPQQYRERYGLRSDYPMTAPNYAEIRRELAKRIGLGRKRVAAAEDQQKVTPAAKKSGRIKLPHKPKNAEEPTPDQP